jgi:hypothetical protein
MLKMLILYFSLFSLGYSLEYFRKGESLQYIEMQDIEIKPKLPRRDSDPDIAAFDEIFTDMDMLEKPFNTQSLAYEIVKELEQKENPRSAILFLFSLAKGAASYTWSTGEKVWGYLSYPFSAKPKDPVLPL